MKRLLIVLLCIAVLVPLGVTVAAENDSNENALELFGFPLDPDSYDTQALKKGTYPVSPKYDLYVNDYDLIKLFEGRKQTKGSNGENYIYSELFNTTRAYQNEEDVPYSVVTGFSASGTGVNDYIAKVYFPYGKKGANICLAVYDAEGNAIVTGFETGGYVKTSKEIKMWEVEGLLSITAGDFDGDGIDEIAVYTPNNAEELEYGKGYVTLGIFEFDAKNKKITLKQYIDLSSKSSSTEVCEWEFSRDGNTKQYYCLPYVALSANDLNGDGIDDLSAIVNFSTWFRGDVGDYTKYTTKALLNHNSRFASVLESYEGTEGGNLKQVIRHKVLVTTPLTGGSEKDPTKEHRYILRNANITVGDVTQEGSREIIIAGNYTRADVKNTSDNSTIVASKRYVEVDGNHALCHIVGYTTYDNLKNHNTYDLNSDYNWTVQRDGNDWTYWYNTDNTDAGPITTSLVAYKHYGTGTADIIFVGGQLFAYDNEEGKLKFLDNYNGTGGLYQGSNGSNKKTSVVWIGGAVAGNFSDDKFGREMLVFPFYLRVSGKDKHTCKLLTLGEGNANALNGGESFFMPQTLFVFEDQGHRLASLALLDGKGKTSYITYPGNDTEVYYSDIEALSIMQAPPVYEELDDKDYMDSETSFEKSESTSTGKTNSGTFSIGPVIGFEYKASFLGIIPCGGAEYEFSLTASVSHEKSTEKTYTYATGFATTGTTDAVTVFTVPYVRYNCQIYMPEYTLPSQFDYNIMCEFRDELTTNLENCLKTGEEQITGEYVRGCEYYDYKYSSYVSSDNYQAQLDVLQKVTEEIKFIEDGIESFGNGGTGKWNQIVEGTVMPYTYSVPQTPLLATVDVATYDSIAEFTPGLEKIYGNVFPEHYSAGDPDSYAKNIGELNAEGNVIQSKQSGSQTDGFLTNSTLSAPGTSQTQTISIEESESSSIGWGVAIENTSLAIASVAKVGFTASLEHNTSYVTTNTIGYEYSATQNAMPDFATSNYSYDWKLVSYNTLLNGSKVPVVGYIVRNVKQPPSVAHNIKVHDVTSNSATITWEDGSRKADSYTLYRVYTVNGKEYTTTIATDITSENGSYSYELKNLGDDETTKYVLESRKNNGIYSVPSQQIYVTTFPIDFSDGASITVKGIEDDVIYRNGKAFNLSTVVTGNEGYETFYQWQIDTGNGWEDLHGQNTKDFKFTISPLDNGKKVRCSAVIIISRDSAYTLYSDPIVMNCARTDGDYQVDWEGDTIKIVSDTEDSGSNMMFVRVSDADGKVVKVVPIIGGAADLSEYLGKGYDLRLYIWDNNFSPITQPFER